MGRPRNSRATTCPRGSIKKIPHGDCAAIPRNYAGFTNAVILRARTTVRHTGSAVSPKTQCASHRSPGSCGTCPVDEADSCTARCCASRRTSLGD